MNFSASIKSSMKYAFFIPLIAAWLVLAQGCNIINPAEVVPTYVTIDSFAFQGNTSSTGSNSHRISSVAVYLNNQSVGIFDLPATLPVILDKPGKLLLTAGVNYNGMHSYQIQYPFYLSDTVMIQPGTDPNVSRKLTPVARYNPAVLFSFTQDFENYVSAPFINDGSDTSIGVGNDPAEAFEGKYGLIDLSSLQDSSVNITRDAFSMPVNTDLYLEMDYKSNIPVTVGLQTTYAGDLVRAYILGLNPRATWGKIYIDLRTFASTYQGGTYHLVLRADRTSGTSEGKVFIDNLKIVHF